MDLWLSSPCNLVLQTRWPSRLRWFFHLSSSCVFNFPSMLHYTLLGLYLCMELFLCLSCWWKKKGVNSSIQGTRPVRNAYLEPAWWLHHPRRRCGEQCDIVCREIHNRALCFTERGSTWPLRHIHPEETVCRDSVLCHTQHHLSGSLLLLNLLISWVRQSSLFYSHLRDLSL